MPTRTCIVCRTARPKRELLRVVRTPEGSVVVDPSGRLAGRGAYLCDDPACRARAATPNVLVKSLGAPVPGELRAALAGDPDTNVIQEA